MTDIQIQDQMFTALFDSLAEGIVVIDENGKIIMANRRSLKLFGYEKGELMGADLEMLVPDRFKKKHEKHRESYSEDPRMRAMGKGLDLYARRKDGTEFPVEISLSYTRSFDKMRIIAFIIDITERKKVELTLRREKEKAQLYLDIATSIFVVVDMTGNVTLINQKGCEILGYKEKDILGKNWFDNFVPADVREKVQHVFNQMISGELEKIEFFNNEVLRRNGSRRLIEWHNTIVRDEHNQIAGTLSSGIDITKVSQIEKLQMEALHHGQENERRRLARELHDGLVQTLSAVNINLNVLEEGIEKLDKDERNAYKKALHFLKEAIKDTRNISHDLMPYGLELSGLVKAIQNLCKKVPENITVDFSYSDNIGRLNQHLELGIYRILQELINNILKHADADAIKIALFRYDEIINLKVEDNGSGFSGTLDEVKLNGIGLRNITTRVISLNGKLDFESRQRKGVRVHAVFPI
ncbi:MAG: PAS domain S-box protein [Cytophagales bacterium]|nr:PAS domain S-box protein [Cytophagales bacterium]